MSQEVLIYPSSTGGGTGVSYITDAGIISTITDEANWNESGNYTGSTVSLNAGDVYFDLVNGYRYEYDGTNLTRGMINNTI